MTYYGMSEEEALTSKELLVPSLRGAHRVVVPVAVRLTSKELLVPALRVDFSPEGGVGIGCLTSKELLVPSLRVRNDGRAVLRDVLTSKELLAPSLRVGAQLPRRAQAVH